ncbi:hypothetical protein EDB85DRAFT_2273193 [Lactarius pseudohatsudake]|nr:hypothetical protein EDB85DRAFT_2273193 [Lactarius pseudohatsudake]
MKRDERCLPVRSLHPHLTHRSWKSIDNGKAMPQQAPYFSMGQPMSDAPREYAPPSFKMFKITPRTFPTIDLRTVQLFVIAVISAAVSSASTIADLSVPSQTQISTTFRHSQQPVRSGYPSLARPDPALFIVVHEADVIQGPQAARTTNSLEVFTNVDGNGGSRIREGLLKWEGNTGSHGYHGATLLTLAVAGEANKIYKTRYQSKFSAGVSLGDDRWVLRRDTGPVHEKRAEVSRSNGTTRGQGTNRGWHNQWKERDTGGPQFLRREPKTKTKKGIWVTVYRVALGRRGDKDVGVKFAHIRKDIEDDTRRPRKFVVDQM